MLSTISMFIEHLEEIVYKQELIYRSLLVTKNDKESNVLKRELTKKDYSAKILRDIDCLTDYNMLDNRILILRVDKFIDFVQYIDKHNGGILNSTYSLIAFSYLLDDQTVDILLSFYVNKTKNNVNGTLFLDKKVSRYLYLKNIVT